MKKIGILTFHAPHNYGSMLQAWALQSYLTSRGYEVENINLRPKSQKRMYPNPLGHLDPHVIKRFIDNPRLFCQDVRKWYKFESFLKNKLKHTKKEYKNWDELYKDLPFYKYDAIVCGGDQIWNTTCLDFDKSYYLPSPLPNTKKISYAPSMGGFLSHFSDEKTIKFIQSNLNDFNYISVRETTTSHFLSKILEKNIEIVPDPTLLLTADDYNQLIPSAPIIKGDYILYYTPRYVKESEEIAYRLGKYYNLPIVSTNAQHNNPHFIIHNSVGPIEFLNILKHAKFVCGQSFHLVIFALIYHKDFVALDGDKDLRMLNLLESCDLKDRAISLKTPQIGGYSAINEEKIDIALHKFKKKGIKYINSWNENEI